MFRYLFTGFCEYDTITPLRCTDCDAFFGVSDAIKYGRTWKCRPCHASYRYVRDNDPQWTSMNAEQRRKAILANRTESKRGVTRKLISAHKVGFEFNYILISSIMCSIHVHFQHKVLVSTVFCHVNLTSFHVNLKSPFRGPPKFMRGFPTWTLGVPFFPKPFEIMRS